MAREPTYPDDAPIGGKAGATAPKSEPSEGPGPPVSTPEAKATDPRRRKHVMAGAAIGIGSAAIVAALLYANRGRRNDKA